MWIVVDNFSKVRYNNLQGPPDPGWGWPLTLFGTLLWGFFQGSDQMAKLSKAFLWAESAGRSGVYFSHCAALPFRCPLEISEEIGTLVEHLCYILTSYTSLHLVQETIGWSKKEKYVCMYIYIYIYIRKRSDIKPSMVTHTRNLCSAFNPSRVHTHTQQWTHTHTRSSGQPVLRYPGSSSGFGALLKGTSVVVLSVERALYIHSPPPTIPAGPRLEPTTFRLRVQRSNH